MKTAMAITMAALVLGGTALFAQDGPVVSVSGLNLQAGSVVNVQFSSAKDELLAGTEKFAQGASRVTEINLNPETMGFMGNDHFGPGGSITKKMKLMVVHTYQYDKPGAYRMEDVEAYAKKLQDGSWSCPVVSREKDRFSYICAKTDSDQTNEMVILSAEPQQLTFIHMAGAMSFNDLSNLSGSAKGIEKGVEHNSDFNKGRAMWPMPPSPPSPTPAPKPQQ